MASWGPAAAEAVSGQVQVVEWMQGQQCPMDKAALALQPQKLLLLMHLGGTG